MRALIWLLLFASLSAQAATKYIDPDCALNGDGTTTSCAASAGGAGAYNTWESATTWTGNAKFYQKGGSTFTDDDGTCNYLINASGADDSNRITVGAYGTGKAKIVCTAGSYIFAWASDRAYITLENLDLTSTGASTNCIYAQSGNHETIQDNIFRSCAAAAISMDGGSAAYNHDNTRILRNVLMATGSKGIVLAATSSTQNFDYIEIAYNDFQGGISSDGNRGPAIDFLWTNGVSARVRSLLIHHNTFENLFTSTPLFSSSVIRVVNSPNITPVALTSTVTITNASPGVVTYTAHGLPVNAPISFTTTGGLPAGLSPGVWYYVVGDSNYAANTFTVSATQGGAAINTSSAGSGVHTGTVSGIQSCIRIPYFVGVQIHDNTITRSYGGIHVRNLQGDPTYGVSDVYNNTLIDIYGSSAIGSFYGDNVRIHSNFIDGVTPTNDNSFIDGIGINRDYCDYNGWTWGNFITHVRGTTAVNNNGQGLGFFANEAQWVFGNVVIGNKDGFVQSDNGPRTVPSVIENNVFSLNTRDGIYLNFLLSGSIDKYYNNTLAYNGGYGARAYASASKNQVMDFNNYYGNTLGARQNDGAAGIVTGASDVAIEPGWMGGTSPTVAGDFCLKPTSGQLNIGTSYSAFGLDFYGHVFGNPPHIGAMTWCRGRATAGTRPSSATRH